MSASLAATSLCAPPVPVKTRACAPPKTASSSAEEETSTSEVKEAAAQIEQKAKKASPAKEVNKFARDAASTFAPRPSGAVKNPAFKGSLLYTIFEVQAWLSLVVGGLLSYNIIFPTDEPSIARLIGMWSIWMFTVPSLRARECTAAEKDWLNYLFLLIPIINVGLPFVWKSFPFIYTADVAALAGMYLWKVGLPKDDSNSAA
ncbi:hypothetical protein WJX72_010235 [[Myrmecia] bisecta]|uniref:Uncharacterized protein n=1 Tax=[Myrmecia] bisecta TaxID=41462 RepID=A0AAW1P9X3_9CHLO